MTVYFTPNQPDYLAKLNEMANDAVTLAGESADSAAAAADSAADADAAAVAAAAAQVSAETAQAVAAAWAGIYSSTALGIAATVDPEYFSVPSAVSTESLILYKNVAEVATQVTTYPSTAAALKPTQTGKQNGWFDPFFRRVVIDAVSEGRTRWATPAATSLSLVANAVFSGSNRALQKAADNGTTNLTGPIIHLDEMGAVAGDTITIRALIVGTGAVVNFPARPLNAALSSIGTQQNATPATVTASATPQLMTVSFVTPALTSAVKIFPYTNTASQAFQIVALWAFKGAATAGPEWPIFGDDEYLLWHQDDHEDRVVVLEDTSEDATAKLDYALDRYGVVDSVSESVNITVTSPSTLARDLPFRGWGERFVPHTVSFNAIRIPVVSRTAVLDSSRWTTIRVVIRTGASSHQAGSTVIAVGSTNVLKAEATQTNLTILLKDPTTGAVKTLTDADFTGSEYFIGIYAENDAGTYASCGEPRGTVPNPYGTPQSYYITTANPLTGAWTATSAGSNVRLGFYHLLLTTPTESTEYSPTPEFSTAVSATMTAANPDIVVPPYIFGVVGQECNVYIDNLHYGPADDYLHNFAASYGTQQNERWTWTPTAAVSSGTLAYSAYDKRAGELLITGTAQLRAAATAAGTGLTKKVIVVGDSWVNAGVITQTMLDVASADVMGITLYGTRGTGGNFHEGRGGWTIDDYTTAGRTYYIFTVSGVVVNPVINSTVYTNNGATCTVQEINISAGSGTITCSVTGGTPAASGTLTKSSGTGDATIAFSASATVSGNPFWDGAAIDFAAYLTDNTFPVVDWVFIGLGVNDAFSQTDDVACAALADAEFIKLDTLITSIKASDAGTQVALMLPGPGADQDAFGASYGVGQTAWRYKRNMLIWASRLIEKYNGQEANRIYIVPCNTALDVVNNMPVASAAAVNSRNATTSVRQNNGVHPATSGYQQIGDAIWAFLKYYA